MIILGRVTRIAAAVAALGANVALAGGLVSLAQHYEAQAAEAAEATEIATAQAGRLQCRPERGARG